MPIWDDILTDTDKEVIRKGGYGQSRGLGARPLLMIIDPQYNYCGDNRPVLDQIDRWPSGAGKAAWKAVGHITRILEAVRSLKLPVIYTRQVSTRLILCGFNAKANRDRQNYLDGAKGTCIVDQLTPREGELVIDKYYTSAFYGTPLLSVLIALRIDTLLITGGSTSGCVRAACVDAVSRNFNVAVLQDAVFDRISASHKTGLLDLWMKYCDVISTDDALNYLESLEAVPCGNHSS